MTSKGSTKRRSQTFKNSKKYVLIIKEKFIFYLLNLFAKTVYCIVGEIRLKQFNLPQLRIKVQCPDT